MSVYERFRRYLIGNEIGYPVSVFDPVSARIARHLGAELGILGGSVASAAVLAAPDLIVLTLSELADQVRRITRAADVSLMVDADHGYGNALNVIRTVQELEAAGAAALTIEDTLLPTPFGETAPRLISLGEMVGKLEGALEARRDPGLVVIGRTSAPQHATIEEVRERVKAYSSTGVDALMLIGVSERDQVEAVREVTDLPLVMGSYGSGADDLEFLRANGVRIMIRGHQPFYVAMKSLHDAMKHIIDGSSPSDLKDDVASSELQDSVLRTDQYRNWQKDFLS